MVVLNLKTFTHDYWWVPGVNIWMPGVNIFLVAAECFFHLASYPVDRLDIQGRGKGPLLGSRWEELLHFEEPCAVVLVGPFVGLVEVLPNFHYAP